MCALFFRLGKIDRVSHFCPMSTQILKMYQHIWYQLIVTIKGFNLDAYFFISVKYEMYNKAVSYLSLHLNNLQRFLVNTSKTSRSR